MTLKPEELCLTVIDVQGNLAQLMHEKEVLFRQLKRMIRGALLFNIPIIWLEQVPQKLGPTIPEITELLTDYSPIPKFAFSCCNEPNYMEALKATTRNHVVLTGIESHICVYQTCKHLINENYQVSFVTDAISSQTQENKQLGITRMQMDGGFPTSVEMLLFELQGFAEGDRFKAMAKLFK